jgi:phosphoglycerate dehydrogenase-like enzyme
MGFAHGGLDSVLRKEARILAALAAKDKETRHFVTACRRLRMKKAPVPSAGQGG